MKGFFFLFGPSARLREMASFYGASRSHLLDTPHSVNSDQSDAETSNCQYAKLTRDKLPCPGGIQTHNASMQAVANPRLRPSDN